MKSLLFALSFLLFASAASAATDPVVDFHGEPLRTDTSYYIVSAIIGAGGGGLNLAAGRNKTCPLDVIQERSDLKEGRPLTFSPANSNDHLVYCSTDLNIQFTTSPLTCNEPSVWRVDNYDESTGKWYISTNGVKGNPGAQTLRNWFKFEKIGEESMFYRIVYCPTVCESCVHLCSDVSRYSSEDGVRRLALSEDQFPITFVKAGEDLRLIRQKWMLQ
ncbi:Kunitz trypsin inhibitor [Melia azedarach]|uniref:Kunitz trypsin inhibitor n=1 Tax=Melia azedarach TaxID=155640 RepID=A0ACC1XTS2_MELAZ|nr:Kunitz trypsin inhibitor [Melia azedarach]KAJ4713700.1 Kunitz trypsin inhibitor [Melia azedarach]